MVEREREVRTDQQYPFASGPPAAYSPPPAVSSEGRGMMGRFRPLIALGIICATIFSCLGLWIGLQLEAIEIITAIIGGLFGFLGGVSLKVLENE